eukprot:46340-Hanusia_phi.AAC.9
MEFCENGDLASVYLPSAPVIRKYKRCGKRVEESRIWTLFFQIACALHECHCRKQKILHRDIKPANVFIDRNNGFKLGDFGLARVLSTETQLAKTNVGTPYYMAPEQVNELPYNEKCDIWSLGCLLYEMAALAPPFEAANQLALAVKIKAGRVSRLPEQYSDELNQAVRSMLQLDSSKRPSIEDLFKLPKMQEQAEIAVRNASAVPAQYVDRYFSSQMRRLQAKEEEISSRAQDLVNKEKELRGAKYMDSEEIKKREEDLKKKDEDLKKRERELSDMSSSYQERMRNLEAREKAVSAPDLEVSSDIARQILAREEALASRDRSLCDKEKRVDKAKLEYQVLMNDLKKKMVLEAEDQTESGNLEYPEARNLFDANKHDDADIAHWKLERRHSCSDVESPVRSSSEPRRQEEAPTGSNPNPQFAGRVRELRRMCMKSSEEPRSPTPHPRQGYLFDKEEENKDGKKKEDVGRKMTVDSKRQAIYGALFGKRAGGKELSTNDSDSEEDSSIAPLRLNGR